MPSALAIDWSEVRKCSEAGVTDERLSEEFGVEKNAIKQRRWREKWMTPAKIEEQAEIARATAEIKAKTPTRNLEGVTAVTGARTALEIAGENLLLNGQEGSLLASNLALSLLRRAASNPDALKPILDGQDIATNLKTVRLAAGMDKEKQDVTVNLAMFSQDGQGWSVSGESKPTE